MTQGGAGLWHLQFESQDSPRQTRWAGRFYIRSNLCPAASHTSCCQQQVVMPTNSEFNHRVWIQRQCFQGLWSWETSCTSLGIRTCTGKKRAWWSLTGLRRFNLVVPHLFFPFLTLPAQLSSHFFPVYYLACIFYSVLPGLFVCFSINQPKTFL